MRNSSIDQDARRAQDRAKSLGALARGRRQSMDTNPNPRGTLERHSWDSGWRIEDSRRLANAEARSR